LIFKEKSASYNFGQADTPVLKVSCGGCWEARAVAAAKKFSDQRMTTGCNT
jgi:hypothetical protein